jgi:hypothetical protein
MPHNPVRANRRLVAGLCAVPLAVLLGAGSCDNVSTAGTCPAVPPGQSLGTPAKQAAAVSMTLELSRRYLDQRVRALTAPAATDTSGVNVTAVTLSDSDAPDGGGQILLSLKPWLLGSEGKHAELPQTYVLGLNIVPYLVNAATMPDAAQREALVTDGEGVVLRFEFANLESRSAGRMAATMKPTGLECAPGFDLIDQQVLSGILNKFATSPPTVPVPSGQFGSVVASLTGTPPKLTGAAVGTNSDGLRLGFVLDAGTPDPFDSDLLKIFTDFNSHDVDWGVQIDTEYLETPIRTMAKSAIESAHAAARFDGADITFGKDGIEVVANGTIRICGDFTVSGSTTVTPAIVRNLDGKSVLTAPSTTPKITNGMNPAQAVCAFFDAIGRTVAGIFSQPFGQATLVVASGCRDVMGDPVEFEPAPGERFYATDISTDGLFLIGGRSTAVDAVLPGRTPVPAC